MSNIEVLFEEYIKKLERKGLTDTLVLPRVKSLILSVQTELKVSKYFLGGSYMIHTMLPHPNSDIDVFTVLPTTFYDEHDLSLPIRKVKEIISKKYPETTSIGVNGDKIVVSFSNFNISINPLFDKFDGGYLFPDVKHSKWVSTDPRFHTKYFNQVNNKHSGSLAKVVRMAKIWNKINKYPFTPFYLTLLCAAMFADITISNYSNAIVRFFAHGSDEIKNQYKMKDPFGSDFIDGLLNIPDANKGLSLFELAYYNSVRADEFVKEGNLLEANLLWRKTFGDDFPDLKNFNSQIKA